MTEKAEYAASLDLTQVQKSLEQTRDYTEKAVTAYGSLAGSMTKVELSSKAMATYSAAAAKEVENFQYKIKAADVGAGGMDGALRKLRPTLAASAASISLVSSALGEQAGAAGKVINIGGQMLAAYGAGGPFGLAFAAGVTAVTLLSNKYDDLIKKQDEALGRQFKATDQATLALNKVEDDLAGIHEKTLTPAAAAYASVQREIDKVKATQAEYRKGIVDTEVAQRQLNEMQDAGLDGQAATSQQIIDENENRKQAIGILDKVIEKLERKQALESALAGPGDANNKAAAQQLKFDQENAQHTLAAQAQLDDELDALYRERLQKRADDEQTLIEQSSAIYERMVEARKEADDDGDEKFERHIQRDIAAQQRFAAASASLVQTAIVGPMQAGTSQALDSFQSYLDMKITGEKNAELKTTAAFMKGIGSQLVGIGLRSEFEGAAKLFDPATLPIGVAEMGFGGAAIAAGLALGAGGAAVGHVAAGGTIGQALPDAAKHKGINGGGGGGRGGGSGGPSQTVINVTYGAAGPAPQDTGRAVVDAMNAFGRASGQIAPPPQGPRR